MRDFGDDAGWHIDAGGNRYHRKPMLPVQPTPATMTVAVRRSWLVELLAWLPVAACAVLVAGLLVKPTPPIQVVEVPSQMCER